MFVSGLEKQNPEALLEVEKENLREQIAKYNKGLASHAGLCERLMTETKKLEKQEDELRAKTAANLKAGNKKLAGQHAVRLQQVRAELEDLTRQLEEAETTYEELKNARDVSIKAAKDKINELKRSIDDMKINQAVAELNEMASGMISEIGGSGDTLDRLHEMVEEERTKAAGRARVARDSIDTTEISALAGEQEAMADMALADFAAAEGIVLDDESGSDSGSKGEEGSKKTMGPKESA